VKRLYVALNVVPWEVLTARNPGIKLIAHDGYFGYLPVFETPEEIRRIYGENTLIWPINAEARAGDTHSVRHAAGRGAPDTERPAAEPETPAIRGEGE
jgi:hypothetical protein